MKNILIVGCGGIGSFLSREINRLMLTEQINLNNVSITLMDFDNVEMKNIKYQNFTNSDIGKNKAEVLGERYCLDYKTQELTRPEQMKGYDIIISCVDNAEARRKVFEYCFKNDVYFIDGRSEGKAIALFTKTAESTKEKMLETLNGDDGKSKSCQLKYELEKGIIQQGNLIVATILSQLLLNKLRGEDNRSEYRYVF